MKKIKIAIIILTIVIIILGIFCFIVNKNRKEEIYMIEYAAEDKPPEEYEPKILFEQVKNEDVYFTIKKIVQTTVTYVKQINGIIGMQTYTEKEVSEQGIEMLLNILDEEYKTKYNITNDAIYKKVNHFTDYDLKIDKIYLSEASDHIYYYLVYATLDDFDFNLLVKTDTNNKTYSIFLQDYINDNGYSCDMTEDKINFDNTDITKNTSNSFSYVRISDQYMVDFYLQTYKDMMFSNVDKAYDLLDEQYKNKRFGNRQSFEKYVSSNKEELSEITVAQYLKNTYKDYTEYVAKDQFNNIYVFKSYYVMDYKVELDDYTISTEELDEEYMKLSKQEKVANNINRWIKMLNHRDYQAAFNVLDETFRTENFQNSVDEFEKYMRYYFPDHYKIEFEEFSEEAGTYIQKIIMEDITGENTMKTAEHIYMELGEGTDFVMSFNVL